MSTTPSEQRQAILAAALDLLATGGAQALRVRDIAAAAGCTTMTVYSRFGGKDGIIEAIYIDGHQRFNKALQDVVGGRPAENCEAFAMAYRQWAIDNPGSYLVMFTEAVPGFVPSDSAVETALASFQVLLNVIEAQQAQGIIREGDATEIAWVQWGFTHGLVMLELAGITFTTGDAGYRTGVDAMFRGFAPEAR